MIKCGNCKQKHETVSDVRTCYGNLIYREAVANAVVPDHVRKASEKYTEPALPDVPEGRYATPTLTGNNDIDFWKVDRPTEGQWAGYVFVKRVIGGHPDVQVRGKQKLAALQAIKSYGIDEAHTLFGAALGICWRCGRHLTDETSRSLGIGPECRSK